MGHSVPTSPNPATGSSRPAAGPARPRFPRELGGHMGRECRQSRTVAVSAFGAPFGVRLWADSGARSAAAEPCLFPVLASHLWPNYVLAGQFLEALSIAAASCCVQTKTPTCCQCFRPNCGRRRALDVSPDRRWPPRVVCSRVQVHALWRRAPVESIGVVLVVVVDSSRRRPLLLLPLTIMMLLLVGHLFAAAGSTDSATDLAGSAGDSLVDAATMPTSRLTTGRHKTNRAINYSDYYLDDLLAAGRGGALVVVVAGASLECLSQTMATLRLRQLHHLLSKASQSRHCNRLALLLLAC